MSQPDYTIAATTPSSSNPVVIAEVTHTELTAEPVPEAPQGWTKELYDAVSTGEIS